MILNNEENDRCMAVLKLGTVVEVMPSALKATVVFDDDDSVLSKPLPIVLLNSLKNKDFVLPDPGEDVLCLFGTSGLEDGYILGTIYAGDVTPPAESKDIRMVKFADGSEFSFDRSGSVLDIKIGSSVIKVEKTKVSVETSAEVNIKAANTVNIEGSSQVNIKTSQLTLNVNGTTMSLTGSSATIESSQLTFKGAMVIDGQLSVQGNVTVSGTGAFSGNISAPNI